MQHSRHTLRHRRPHQQRPTDQVQRGRRPPGTQANQHMDHAASNARRRRRQFYRGHSMRQLVQSVHPAPTRSLFYNDSTSIFSNLHSISITRMLSRTSTSRNRSRRTNSCQGRHNMTINLVEHINGCRQNRLITKRANRHPNTRHRAIHNKSNFNTRILVGRRKRHQRATAVTHISRRRRNRRNPRRDITSTINRSLRRTRNGQRSRSCLVSNLTTLRIIKRYKRTRTTDHIRRKIRNRRRSSSTKSNNNGLNKTRINVLQRNPRRVIRSILLLTSRNRTTNSISVRNCPSTPRRKLLRSYLTTSI